MSLPLPRETAPRNLDECLTWWTDVVAPFIAAVGGQPGSVALINTIVADVRSFADSEQPVTLTRAAALTGFSADHLGRLIKFGRLTNHGRKHAPRVKLSECPRKPAIASSAGPRYNVETDALSLRAHGG